MSIEAMKLALEALEEIHPSNMTPMAEEAWNKAITALRQGLARMAALYEKAANDRDALFEKYVASTLRNGGEA